jgi:hypothetical protein
MNLLMAKLFGIAQVMRWVGAGGQPADAPLRTVRESFPSHGSSLAKANPAWVDPLPDEIRCATRTQRNPLGQLGNTRVWALTLCSCGQQLRDALSDWHRSSFAFPGGGASTCFLAMFDRTDVGISGTLHPGFSFFGLPNAAPALPALRWGRPRPAWPRTAAFPCSAFDAGR